MADFLRPEAKAQLWRFRDALMGGGVALLGLYWGLTRFGILSWIGWIMVAGGIIWTLAGLQRARFRQGEDGPGVVQVRERRFAYFGPLDGGVMDVDDLRLLEIDPTSHPSPSWVLTGEGGQRLAIPVNATGAEDLFDVFAALPDIRTEAMLDVLSRTPDARVVIWQRTSPLLH